MDETDNLGGGMVPEWMVTFGDMMSLLLTFFIMLVSMSEIKQEERFQAMMESMRLQFGPATSSGGPAPGENTILEPDSLDVASLGRAKRRDLMQGGTNVKAPGGEQTIVRTLRPGREPTAEGVVYFEEDAAVLDDEDRERLREVAAAVAGSPLKVEVRGHAARHPLAEGDHWGLAYERGRIVIDFLVAQGIDPGRMRLSSAGAEGPLDTGPAAPARLGDDRVEVLLWDERVAATD